MCFGAFFLIIKVNIMNKSGGFKKKLKIFFIGILILVVLFFALVVVTYFIPSMETSHKPSFSQFLINSIHMFIRPSEAMWYRASFYTDDSKKNYWDQYNYKSIFWIKMSAWFGGYHSMAELGGYYFFKKKDIKSAIYWMEKAAADKSEDSYYSYKPKLALLYCQEGEFKNEEKALAIYKESADYGVASSAEMYLKLLKVLHPDEYEKISEKN